VTIPRAVPRSACPPTVRTRCPGLGVPVAGGRPVDLAEPGLTPGLARWRVSRAAHDPGKVITDPVMTLALDGDCPADFGVLTARRRGPGKPDGEGYARNRRLKSARPYRPRIFSHPIRGGQRVRVAPGPIFAHGSTSPEPPDSGRML
jgi:hypothetical protein